MPTAIRLKSFRINKRGVHQLQITIPRIWIDEQGLQEGDTVDLMKDTEDRLIIVPGRRQEQEAGRE